MAASSSSSVEAILSTPERPAAWDTPAALVKRYFHQLTQGCGRKWCPNRNCRACPDGHGALDPTAAAVMSLQLAQGHPHRLCDDGPPFLHLELVRDLVAAGDTKRLVKELAGVFSNSEALNQSFLLTDAEARELAQRLGVAVSELSCLDTAAVVLTYCELLRLGDADVQPHGRGTPGQRPSSAPGGSSGWIGLPRKRLGTAARLRSRRMHRLLAIQVLNAVMNATEGLLCKLQVSQQTQPNFIAAGPAVRQLAILMANPLLLEPQYHKQARVRVGVRVRVRVRVGVGVGVRVRARARARVRVRAAVLQAGAAPAAVSDP